MRFAFWKKGKLHVVGIGKSSIYNYDVVPDFHEAARRIRYMIHIGFVSCGLLYDACGQWWNEKLELLLQGQERKTL